MPTKVVILRGLPGSGKSTYATQRMEGHSGTICSADDFPGLYNEAMEIDFTKLGDAHDACFTRFVKACSRAATAAWLRNFPVSNAVIIVDNTNITLAEMAPYRMFARHQGLAVEFVTAVGPCDDIYTPGFLAARNIHNVPAESIARMRDRWENLPPFWEPGTSVMGQVAS